MGDRSTQRRGTGSGRELGASASAPPPAGKGDSELRESEARLRAIVQHSFDSVVITDERNVVVYASPAVEDMFGWSAEELVGSSGFRYVHPDDLEEARERGRLTGARPGERTRAEFRLRHRDGSYRWVESISTNLTEHPHVRGFVQCFRDVTERRHAEERARASEARLEHQATHDPLTDLPNRTLLFRWLREAAQGAGHPGERWAVLFCDLDAFTLVNDRLGHAQGDAVLREAAQRLRTSVRPQDLVARIGGDEFVVLLPGVEGTADALAVAARVQDRLRAPIATARGDVHVTITIGIALAGEGTRDPGALLHDADAAMYRARQRGRAGIEVFDATMRHQLRARHELERALRDALSRHELQVYFQPVVDLAGSGVRGVEALVRWAHPERGLLLPGDFIGIAEETGLMVPLGAWVLGQACQQVAVWQRRGGSPLWLAVNLSARQLAEESLVDDLANAVAASGIDPRSLHVEITESELMRDVAQSLEVLQRLKVLGVRVAIDDFGTGYSSLSYLRTLPVDVLKIDRSFVAALDHAEGAGAAQDGTDLALVEMIVELGHILAMEVVAEGVETPRQAALLRERGCDLAQGFHFARPLPAAELDPMLLEP